MARTYWNIYTYDSSNDTWIADGQIPAPNNTLTLGLSSTLQKIDLADGDEAIISPEVKYKKSNITFTWVSSGENDLSSLITKIENYIQNHTKIKIVDSQSTEHIGYFTNIRKNWIVGVSTTFDVEADFTYS